SRQSRRARYEFENSADDADQGAASSSATAASGDAQKPPGAAGRNPLLEGVCRACIDINDVLAGRRKLQKTSTEQAKSTPECPLDQVSLGRKSWSVLHTLAAYYPDKPTARQSADMDTFLRSFSRLFPCPHCSEEFQANIAKSPPPVRDGRALNRWLCDQHNLVNERLG
uniref:Sulfhydryl oxidase n=1 Tax=Macrostomum lignano TaxID=282301 RepID=A0A1I8FWA1_9PLAT